MPQFRTGARRCSVKFKGFPLDTWIAGELGQTSYRHVMGFNAEETSRAVRDTSYSSVHRHSEYPLIEWGWGRAQCGAFLEQLFGVKWQKSCCTFCPFARNKAAFAEYLERLQLTPGLAAEAILMERISTALNPRQTLYPNASLECLVEEAGCVEVLAARDRLLAEHPWALYHVQRVYTSGCRADRKLTVLGTGSRTQVEAHLDELAAKQQVPVSADGRSLRFWLSQKRQAMPCAEELLVAAPAGVREKQAASFARRWAQLAQVDLFAA